MHSLHITLYVTSNQNSSKHWNKRHFQLSIFYHLLIGIIWLRLTRERIENRLYMLCLYKSTSYIFVKKIFPYKISKTEICKNNCDSAFWQRLFLLDWNQNCQVQDDANQCQGHLHKDQPSSKRCRIPVKKVGIDKGKKVITDLLLISWTRLVHCPVQLIKIETNFCAEIHWKKLVFVEVVPINMFCKYIYPFYVLR